MRKWSIMVPSNSSNKVQPKRTKDAGDYTRIHTHTLLINTFPKALLASAPPKRAESSKFDGRKSSATETEACYLSTPFPPPAPRIYHTHTHILPPTESHSNRQSPGRASGDVTAPLYIVLRKWFGVFELKSNHGTGQLLLRKWGHFTSQGYFFFASIFLLLQLLRASFTLWRKCHPRHRDRQGSSIPPP